MEAIAAPAAECAAIDAPVFSGIDFDHDEPWLYA
jgi:hypothetical protein